MLKINDIVKYQGELCYIEKIKPNLQGELTYFLRFCINNKVLSACGLWLKDNEFEKIKEG